MAVLTSLLPAPPSSSPRRPRRSRGSSASSSSVRPTAPPAAAAEDASAARLAVERSVHLARCGGVRRPDGTAPPLAALAGGWLWTMAMHTYLQSGHRAGPAGRHRDAGDGPGPRSGPGLLRRLLAPLGGRLRPARPARRPAAARRLPRAGWGYRPPRRRRRPGVLVVPRRQRRRRRRLHRRRPVGCRRCLTRRPPGTGARRDARAPRTPRPREPLHHRGRVPGRGRRDARRQFGRPVAPTACVQPAVRPRGDPRHAPAPRRRARPAAGPTGHRRPPSPWATPTPSRPWGWRPASPTASSATSPTSGRWSAASP